MGWLGELIKQHEHACTEKRILEEILKAKTVCVLILNQGIYMEEIPSPFDKGLVLDKWAGLDWGSLPIVCIMYNIQKFPWNKGNKLHIILLILELSFVKE